MDIPKCVYLSIDEQHLDYLQFGAILNKVTLNIYAELEDKKCQEVDACCSLRMALAKVKLQSLCREASHQVKKDEVPLLLK
jgi:hypothetical protein